VSDTKPGRYVYVVCSTNRDHFAEIAAISITSLRILSPLARVTVLTDRETANVDSAGVAAIRSAVDDFCVVDCPGDSSIDRSRFLKTGMRNFISGRFLYLDSDTIIMRSPDGIWSIDCDVAASPDLSPRGGPYLTGDASPETTATLGWTLRRRRYLNAGVIYFSDSNGAYSVGEHYRSRWSEFLRVTGKPNDQLAFNYAVDLADARLIELHASYNAQISMNPWSLRSAKIVHFFTGNLEHSVETVAHTTAKRLKSEGVIDLSSLKSAIASGNPWTTIDTYRKAIASGRPLDVGKIVLDRLTRNSAT
jgi:hypothetical protein